MSLLATEKIFHHNLRRTTIFLVIQYHGVKIFMKVMILAAGRGERMRPLTDAIPKPLLHVGQHCLIEHHIYRLANAGFEDFVINLAYLGEQIEETLRNGQRYGINIQYSHEGKALGTGGGIKQALPLLGNAHFLVVNGDVWSDYPFAQLKQRHFEKFAHLILVDNPEHHPQGDFCLDNNQVHTQCSQRLTFSGLGVYHPQLFQNSPLGKFEFAPLLIQAMQSKQVTGEHYQGNWLDVGTPQRLAQLRAQYG